GVPTARAITDVREACPQVTIIASGGIRDGLDVARAIRLGADFAGQAAGILPAALNGADAVAEHIAILVEQLRIACFCTASADLAALRRAPLLSGAD
ncbi:MAG TPA: alpha-hydroxy-acid oxidizing protein, partial [Hyphomicrobiaceae bacterium]|nr:alpha-hydroxy-acid oxidizing protein [Hyphomicrobiaceae bacterium]